ncbi:protein of unknown function [Kyrpidia spormannii]|uniref:Uncharacterized protein n=2 Tax=Kyrpidia spormannii TaxID=2055160 RepID=A0ACA8ZC06_9BACL|nr:protein of unknown function [Kyrpidia spormannii]CAB3395281.1 protein of unknown function [Kyrpidia spormannii]
MSATETVQQRIAAKQLLSEIALERVRNSRMIPQEEDEVSRMDRRGTAGIHLGIVERGTR